jgi:hypothetical protein
MTSVPAQAKLTVVPPALPVSLRRRGRTHEQLGLSVGEPSELSFRVNKNKYGKRRSPSPPYLGARPADKVID